MERVIANEGSKTSIYTIFEDVQDYAKLNLERVLRPLFSAYGLNLTSVSGIINNTDTTFKVTYTAGNEYVSINEGEALTSGLNYLSAGPGVTVSTANLTNGIHSLWAQNEVFYDTPVPVRSGYAYNLGLTSNSRAHDSTNFVWDVSPSESGVVLADVTVSGKAVYGVVDRRQENILQLSVNLTGANLLYGVQPKSEKDVANGYAGLDSDAKVPLVHLPTIPTALSQLTTDTTHRLVTDTILSQIAGLSSTSDVTFNSVSAKNVVQVLFDSTQLAPTTSGGTVSGLSVWTESSTVDTGIEKIRGTFVYKKGMKNIVFRAMLKNDEPTGVYAYAYHGITTYEADGTPKGANTTNWILSTTYVQATEEYLINDSYFVEGQLYQWGINLHSGHAGSSAYMTTVLVTLES